MKCIKMAPRLTIWDHCETDFNGYNFNMLGPLSTKTRHKRYTFTIVILFMASYTDQVMKTEFALNFTLF